ncbi:MAG TPA: hypothetical protein PKE38_14930, partial [Ignavibacteriaceae bacterium]|nr:hypothetical protein [Ignavibacteriaceae bacterium]
MFAIIMLINQFINLKVSTRVSTDKNDWNLAYIQVFLMTSDQRVEGSNPSGRTCFNFDQRVEGSAIGMALPESFQAYF